MIEKTDTQEYWLNHIKAYEKETSNWEGRSKKICERYKAADKGAGTRYNILWSNIQTLQPALFDRNPVPNVDRRFEDEDKVATMAARVLERSVTYFIDSDLYNSIVNKCVLDRLLSGRGTAWVRYEPNFKEPLQGTISTQDDGYQISEDEVCTEEELPEISDSEEVCLDYVYWCDFGHVLAKTWEEVPAVWRKVALDKKALTRRFGKDKAKLVAMDYKGKNAAGEDIYGTKATIYEIWDKAEEKVLWLNLGMLDILDEVEDPLGLKDFFPCPAPLYSTLNNDGLTPSPDYWQYQIHANELDTLTARINALTKCVKIAGVYDASAAGISTLLQTNVENKLVPVENWAVFAEKGGMSNAISFMPLKEIIAAIAALYEARERVKQDLYEITGISDIVRGATDPNETLGAQELKGKYAGLRIGAQQKDVARFNRALVRIFAEIISEHFSLDTIKKISGIKLLMQAEKEMIKQQSIPIDGQPPQIPEEATKLMEQPSWEEVMALLKDDVLRNFRITIETDSTIKQDQDNEKTQRIELLTAAGSFIQQSAALPPELQPLAAQLLMFGVRGFKIGRELESTFESTFKKIEEAEKQPPQPDPALQAEQAKQQTLQAQSQAELQSMQLQGQLESQKAATQMQVEQSKAQTEQLKGQIELEKLAQQQQMMALDLQIKDKDIQLKQLDLQIKSQQAQQKQEDANAGQ